MSYKILQRFAVSIRSANRVKSSKYSVNPCAINVDSHRTFCLSKANFSEEGKQVESNTAKQDIPPEQDHFSQKAKEDKASEDKETKEDDEDEGIKESILSASLKFVPGYGWSKQAIEAGTESLGHPSVTSGIIADPGISLVHHHYQVSNDLLAKLMKKEIDELQASNQELKVTPFLKKSIEKRLRMNVPYMSRWAESLAIMTYPQNAVKSLNLGLELVDSMWHVVGDTDVDINWYTKRLTLLGVYKATELAMMQDQSEGFAETWSFLDRRFDDTKNVKELLGAPDDALKILGAVGNTVQAFLGVKR